MGTRIEIIWKGDVPGLDKHRLSISEFGPALEALLKATRRIASGIITNAIDASDYGRGGGKYALQAQSVDVQISGLFESSLGLTAVLVMTAAIQKPLFPQEDLTRLTAIELIECVESEGQSHPRNAKVRQFLEALPSGISAQSYRALDDQGTVIRQTELEAVNLATPPGGFPNLMEISAVVIGAGFPPGPPAVKFKYSLMGDEGEDEELQEKTITCSATEEQVESALGLRNQRVVADIIQIGSSNRLLHLRSGDQFVPNPKPFSDQVIKDHFQRWDAVLKGLA